MARLVADIPLVLLVIFLSLSRTSVPCLDFCRRWRALGLFVVICILSLDVHATAGQNQASPTLMLQTGQTAEAVSIAISPDGRMLASGNAHSITFWDRQSAWILKNLAGHSGNINSVTFSPDGNWLASGSDNGELGTWNSKTGDLKALRSVNTKPFAALLYAKSNDAILSAGWDNTIRLWDEGACENSCIITTTPELPSTMAMSADAKWLAVGTDHWVHVWKLDLAARSLQHYEDLRISESDSGDRVAVAFADSRLVAVNFKGTVLMQSVLPWNMLWKQETGLRLDAAVFSPDNATVFVDGGEFPNVGRTLSYSVVSGERIPLPEDSTGLVLRFRCLAISNDGQWLIAGGTSVVIWNLRKAGMPELISKQLSFSQFATLSPSADAVVVSLMGIHKFSLTDAHFGAFTRPTNLDDAVLTLPLKVAVSPDGRSVATGAMNRQIMQGIYKSCGTQPSIQQSQCSAKMLSGVDPQSIFQLALIGISDTPVYHALGPSDIEAHPVFSEDGSLLLWRTSDGLDSIDPECFCNSQHYSLPMNDFPVLALSPDKTLVATNMPLKEGRGIQLYSIPKQVVVNKISFEQARVAVNALKFNPKSPDGTVQLAGGLSNGDVYVWGRPDASSSSTVLKGHSEVRALAYSLDGQLLAIGNQNGAITIINLISQSRVETEGGHSGAVSGLWFGSSGRWVASTGEDGVIRFWNVSDGKVLGTLLVPVVNGSLSWLFVRPDGRFEGESRAFDSVLWRFSPSMEDVQPVDAFIQEYYFHGLLKSVLRGEPIKAAPPLEEVDRRAPALSISTDPADGPAAVSQRLVRVHVHVDEAPPDGRHPSPAGANDVRLFENGVLVKHWHGPVVGGHGDLVVEVPISAGTNNFTAYAFNNANVKSQNAQAGLLGAGSLREKGTVYVLGIGIDKYQGGIPALHYSANDAKAFVDAIGEHQPNREVVKVVLSDQQANRANILCALSRLGSGNPHLNCDAAQLNVLRPTEPEDSVYILFSGHGISDQGRFFVLPSDSSTTEDFRRATSTSVRNMISDRDFREAFEPILAREQAMVLDACGSGGLLRTNDKSFGPLNLDGFAQLAHEKGLYVLSAATSNQSAMEAPNDAKTVSHSILTYVLVEEALEKNKANYDPTKGISITEWFNYAVQHVPNEANQQPVAFYPLILEDSKVMMVSSARN